MSDVLEFIEAKLTHMERIGGILQRSSVGDGTEVEPLRLARGIRTAVALHEPFECCNLRCQTGLHCRTCDEGMAADGPVHHPCPTILAIAAIWGWGA